MTENNVCTALSINKCDNSHCQLYLKKIETKIIMLQSEEQKSNPLKNGKKDGSITLIKLGLCITDSTIKERKSTESGGGDDVYIVNTENNINFNRQIHLQVTNFQSCEANFGSAVFIYSVSEKELVITESCLFFDNKIISSSSSNQKFVGGSSLYLITKYRMVNLCTFENNKGKDRIIKMNGKFDVVQNLNLLQYHHHDNKNKLKLFISKYLFNVDVNSDCSLFYSNERKV